VIDKHVKTKAGFAPYIVAAAGVITPGAYLLGYSFYDGYMNAFGVETGSFPVSTPNIYVFSYHTVGYLLLSIGEAAAKTLNKLLSPPNIYFLAITSCLVVVGIYSLFKMTQKKKHPIMLKLFEKIKIAVSWLHWKNNDFTKSVGIVGVASYSLLLLATVSIAVALFWWWLPMSASEKGKKIANDRIKLFLSKGCLADKNSNWNNCFCVVDEKGNEIHEGLLIAMNDNVVAIFKKDGSYIFKRKEGVILRRKMQ
jgi:hypothetical protein